MKVGVVAPASPVLTQETIDQVRQKLEGLGYQVLLGETVKPHDGHLAGSDLERRTDLERLWSDETVRAIWCLRGGYGCLRLLPSLYYRLFEQTPKILMGFSDITALEIGLWTRIKLVTFHGPVLTRLVNDATGFSTQQAVSLLSGEKTEAEQPWPWPKDNLVTIKAGIARGILLGGNLATLLSLVGTIYWPCLDGAILFLEEVGEVAYRVDRMLTQLILTGALDSVSAVIIGRCIPGDEEKEADLINMFRERLSLMEVPSAYGFPFGHIDDQWTIPQGVLAEVDTGTGRLTLLESPFEH